MIEGFGGLGFYCETPDQIGPAMQQAFESGKPAIVNIAINPRAGRKPQQFAWLTR
jgi:thiamine pyrophosphate-dependent acetolactate synthase large subunit-like protein